VPAVTFEGVWRRFVLRHDKPRTFQELFVGLFRPNGSKEEFWALRDISFELPFGESLGIMGANGSGKSTLLKLVSSILRPTRGRVQVGGRVSALLEVGAGFHPELTGRENIFLNGAILGLSRRQILEKFDEIVEFSGLQKFIDIPVKHYSSGMYMRLGFSVAVMVEPEILLIDEVLAVGDEAFRKKCLAKIKEYRERGGTIIFVSHVPELVQEICDRAILLHQGEMVTIGDPQDVSTEYHKLMALYSMPEKLASGLGALSIYKLTLLDNRGAEVNTVRTGQDLWVRAEGVAEAPVRISNLRVVLRSEDGLPLHIASTRRQGLPVMWEGQRVFELVYRALPLHTGTYRITLEAEFEGIQERGLHTLGEVSLEVIGRPEHGPGLMAIEHSMSFTRVKQGAGTRTGH
jgi:ABC-type polysaccharide/polyol phosphate transport system ATPase subunit